MVDGHDTGMTYKQFIEQLRKTPRDWFLSNGFQIRRGNKLGLLCLGAKCPLTEIFKVVDAYSQDFSSSVYRAADEMDMYDDRIRADLIDACGLAK